MFYPGFPIWLELSRASNRSRPISLPILNIAAPHVKRLAIFLAIARELKLRDVFVAEKMVRCASNDDVTDVVDYIDQILEGRGR